MSQLQIEYVALSRLKKWPRNPKRHDLPALDRSFERFGFTTPIMIDEKTGLMVAGHGRIEQLVARKGAGRPAPNRIIVEGGEWLVPVIRGIEFQDEKEAEAYLLADNQLTIVGGFDEEVLAAILKDHSVNLRGMGWTEQSLENLMKSIGEPLSNGEIDKVPPLPENATTKTGDVWQLGKHRILCGDSTRKEDVARLLGGSSVDSLITDPPYGVDYAAKTAYLHHAYPHKNPIRADIANDAIEDYTSLFRSFLAFTPFADLNTIYIFMGSKRLHTLRSVAEEVGIHWAQYLVWVKPHFVLGPNDYHYQHEFIFYGWKGKHRYYGPRSNSTVLEYEHPTKQELHPTMKPLALIEQLVSDGSCSGGIVYDPFLGSGTTLIATENLGRTCYGMEIDPSYVDVALKRWENHTGKKANSQPREGPRL